MSHSKFRIAISGLITGILGCIILFRSLFDLPSGAGLWSSNYDPRLLSWIAEWGYHVLFELRQPLEFWNANSFYPHSNSLAYSDSLLSLQLFYGPLRLLGFQKLPALYLSLSILSIAACTLSCFALSRLGKFDCAERILILISSHFSLSMTNFLGHYQLFAVQLAIPFFLYLFLYLRDWKKIDLITVCLIFSFAVCMAGYLAPMLVSLSLITATPILIHATYKNGWQFVINKINIFNIIIPLLTLVALYFITIGPYLQLSQSLPPQDLNESAFYAARPTSILHHISTTSLLYGPDPHYASIHTERAFAPGYILTLLPISALVIFCLCWLSGKSFFSQKVLNYPLELTFLYYLILLLFGCLILALGPYPLGYAYIKLPFYWISNVVPALEHVRTPGRFGMLIGLPLSVILIYLVRSLELRPRLKSHTMWGLVFLVALESLPSHKSFQYKIYSDDQAVYSRLAQEIKAGTPLLELPAASGDTLRSIIRITEQLNGSTIHWARLFVGYGAGTTKELKQLQSLDLGLHRGKNEINDLIDFAKAHSVEYLLIRINRYYPKIQKRWINYIRKSPEIELIFKEGNSALLRLK